MGNKVKSSVSSSNIKPVLQVVRGMHDLLPPDSDYFLALQDFIFKWSITYGFNYVRTPVVESERVFTASLGEMSDVVEKEMFVVRGRERGDRYVLRPEGTAAVVRLYLQHGLHSWSQPVKLFYLEPMFRKERPQAGRYREHYQWGVEVIGSKDPVVDAQVIQMIDAFFKKFKLKDYTFKMNTIGCLNANCRPLYKKKLKQYYQTISRGICVDCKRRLKVNPLRLLDCKNAQCQPFKDKAPKILNYICKECQEHFENMLEYLEEFTIVYELDNTLVRGFDYYSKTVFEIFFPEVTISIGGGGRYDYLVKILGGQDTPGVGWGIGIERLTDILTMHQVNLTYSKKPKVFVIQITPQAKKAALSIVELLRKNNILVSENFTKASLTSQLEIANKLGVPYVLILGHEELGNKSVILRDMKTGAQENVYWSELVERLKEKL